MDVPVCTMIEVRPVKGKQQRARIDGAVSLIIAYCILSEKYTDYMNLMEK